MNTFKSLWKKGKDSNINIDINDYLIEAFKVNIDATFLLDVEGNFLAINKSGEKLLCVSEKEVLGKSFIPYIDKIFLEEMMKRFNKTIKGKPQVTTIDLKNKKSQNFKLHVAASPCYKDKKVCGILVIAKDVTNERKLKQSIELSKELFNQYPEGVFSLTPDREIKAINESLYKLTGFNKNDIDSYLDFFPEEHVREFDLNLKAAFSGDLVQYQAFISTKQNEVLKTCITLIPNLHEDKVESLTVIVKDISLLKEYEANIHNVQRNLNDAQEIANIGSWEYDFTRDEGYWSKQLFRIFGMDPETDTPPTFQGYLNMLHPEDVEECVNVMSETIQKGKRFSHYSRIIRKDGTQRIVQVTGRPVYGVEDSVEKIIGTFYDMTDFLEVKEKLEEKEKQIETIYNNLEEVIWSIDVKSKKVLFCSNGFEEIYGYSLESVISSPSFWENVLHPKDKEKIMKSIKGLFVGEKVLIKHRFIHSSGDTRWADTKCFPVLNENGELIRIDGIMWDITEEKVAEEKIQHSAYHDYLTDLPNRRMFDESVQELLNDNMANNFSVLLLDLDRFKHVNDMLGHEIGDELLIAVSKRLKECVADKHLVARMGGDEFAVILYDVQVEEAIRISNLITSEVRKVYTIGEFDLHITTSIGISVYPFEDGEDVTAKSILKTADTALYNAKHLGRDTYKIYTPSMDIESYKIYHLERDMRQALLNNDFFIEYQTKVKTETGEIIGAEALIRWQHPEWGKVSPSEFIPIAEESDLICEIGEWVIKKVFEQIKEWNSKNLTPVPISVNLSPKQLLKKNLTGLVRGLLHTYQVDPGLIEFELTESTLIEPSEIVLSTIEQIRGMGIKIALDDFGVGYSSITHLKNFKLNTLKIDKSFIDNIMDKEEDQIIITSLIQMAHGLGLTIVAEGVEDQDQLNFLRQKGCDYIQGYLFSKPVLPNELERLLKKQFIKPIQMSKRSNFENRRKYFRINFTFPLLADLTISEIKGKKVKLGTTEVLIEDIGLGGVRFLSQINLPVRDDIILIIEAELLNQPVILHGNVVWKNDYIENVNQYGMQFILSEQETSSLSKLINQLQLDLKTKKVITDRKFLKVGPKEYFSKR
ncbi:hypothetical protein AS034_05375 [[Bacillus] enclensis]|uniref:Diguanylate cyclase/phosphodiesterase with PAS/PAC sensor(S) n=1 Tax=[Bacillus] enclensis TaxID=1402860 RepID=A0A0V8HM87_9BACI|nr:EAL domain-containing protein [[Bacillus] enclensis]KSU63679.1 hypothetical protein AS034_05375 [[Bacillus] enclensis]SCB87950.1 diguanylate cyclase/phosphodiesterase with PAS/PAC sensor(s) [[Bacillus] enclensis]